MKMKDVIAETGLTDRAIRLYIENGLVSPSCRESYTGRRNIDFTEEDIEELSNIAILRKAGFSIGEIKELRVDEQSCRRVLDEFMKKTSERIKSDKEVLQKLEAVAESENVTIKTICESLNAVTKEKEIPKADTKRRFGEKTEKIFFTVLASAGLIYIFGCILYSVLVCKFNYDYLYPTIRNVDFYFFVKLLIVLFTVISCVYLLYTYRKKTLSTGRKKRLITSLTLSVISAFFCWCFFFCTLWTLFSSNACSKTTDPKNYLVLDECITESTITEFFPYKIDGYATHSHGGNDLLIDFPDTYPNSTKYYYKHFCDNFGGGGFTEINVEWKLLDKYKKYSDFDSFYKAHKKKYLKMQFGKPVTVITKGDWQCIYYDDTSEDDWDEGYTYRIFAYNDKTETVRFIFASRYIFDDPMVNNGYKEIVPEFTKLEW
ncbi:MAG: MerR family transcriptional regulator [Ruminococcaceae bacterium]|nr:MerR family transcriptional regulator [Oscillospiraceae bacterium]